VIPVRIPALSEFRDPKIIDESYAQKRISDSPLKKILSQNHKSPATGREEKKAAGFADKAS
jgi:hypothetical protein